MHLPPFLKNYGATLLLLLGIVLGAVAGLLFGEDAAVVKPLGDLFLNLIFVLIVPLVFFSVASAICNMRRGGLVGRLLGTTLGVFLVTSIIAATVSYLALLVWNPLDGADRTQILSHLPPADPGAASGSLAATLVGTFSVSDFPMLLSKSHLLPLILIAALAGFAAGSSRSYAEPVARALGNVTAWIADMLRIIMKLAPVCLGCFFAYTVGMLGGQLLEGYFRAFIIFLGLTVVLYFGLHTLYVWIALGRKGILPFWKAILVPSLTAMGTCSSAACIPQNIEAAKSLGVRPVIADAVIPLGVNIHKDGSVQLGVMKIVFLMTLLGVGYGGFGSYLSFVGVAILVGAVMGAIPTGGMTGELLVCSVFGFEPGMAAVVMVISTMVDIPATLTNSTGNVVSALLVERFTPKQ